MGCCKCEEFIWPDPQGVVYTDPADGKGYCVFHAPADKKGIDVNAFNREVFNRINDVAGEHNKFIICTLSGAIFPGPIRFHNYGERYPLPNIDLSFSSFESDADFQGAYFNGEVDFNFSTFNGKLVFYESIFEGKLCLHECKVLNKFLATRASFINEVDFSCSTFIMLVEFNGAVFMQFANFNNCLFGSRVKFSRVTFNENCTFANSVSLDDANFNGVNMAKTSDFLCAIFESGVNFHKATFTGKANFYQTTFGVNSHLDSLISKYNNIYLHKIDEKSIENIYISSFDTDFFSFKGCVWPEKLYPEIKKNPDYKACEELYRSLKQKAASEHDQPMVSQWHFREKEMALMQIRQKNFSFYFMLLTMFYSIIKIFKKCPSCEQRLTQLHEGGKSRCPALLTVTSLYRITSGYGERPVWAFWCLSILLALPFLITGILELLSSGFSWLPDWTRISEVVKDGLRYIPLTKLPPDNGETSGWHYLLMSVSQLLITIQAALFAFALRNKFRR